MAVVVAARVFELLGDDESPSHMLVECFHDIFKKKCVLDHTRDTHSADKRDRVTGRAHMSDKGINMISASATRGIQGRTQ